MKTQQPTSKKNFCRSTTFSKELRAKLSKKKKSSQWFVLTALLIKRIKFIIHFNKITKVPKLFYVYLVKEIRRITQFKLIKTLLIV